MNERTLDAIEQYGVIVRFVLQKTEEGVMTKAERRAVLQIDTAAFTNWTRLMLEEGAMVLDTLVAERVSSKMKEMICMLHPELRSELDAVDPRPPSDRGR